MRKMLFAVEIVAFILALFFVILWLFHPGGNFEPAITLCGLVGGVGIELYRRNFSKDSGVTPHVTHPPVVGESPEDTVPSLLAWLLAKVPATDLSRTLPYALRLAQKLGDGSFEKWVRLELNGYQDFNGMVEKYVVPETRSVTVRHMDEYQRVLKVDASLSFLNGYRLRMGVTELEELASRNKALWIVDEDINEIIMKHLNVHVYQMTFSPVAVRGVLGSIRNQLQGRLYEIRDRAAGSA